MKRLLLILISAISFSTLAAQVPRKVIVEHFTNTRCSICASKNPGFYQNLNNHPGILHIAYHPSSPYSNCYLNNHNMVENDGRTEFYGVYGSTPRWVIQGEVQPFGTDEDDPSLFDPYTGEESPFSLYIVETRYDTDSVKAEVRIKTISDPGLTTATLFVAYVEDTVFYSAPNGEDQHYDVFRKAFTDIEGTLLNLASTGDSVIYEATIPTDPEWVSERMQVAAILQSSETKEVLQAGFTNLLEGQTRIFQPGVMYKQVSVYPNPARDRLTLESANGPMTITDLSGRVVMEKDLGQREGNHMINIGFLREGLYIVHTSSGSARLNVVD